MADPFGLSFSPGQDGQNGQPVNGQKPSPIQQAIQTLSLRVPRVAGASAFTAQPLLPGQGAGGGLMGDPNSAALLEALKRMLFGGQPSPDQGQQGFQGFQSFGSGPGQATGLEGLFGLPTQPDVTSGTGQPLGGTGTGQPLPTGGGGGIPTPIFVPGSDLPKDNTIPKPPTPLTGPTQPDYPNQNDDTRFI